MDRLNAGLLPKGMIAMAEQVIGGPEPHVVTLQQNDLFLSSGGSTATLVEAPPKPQTQFVMPVEVDRYATYLDTWNVLPQMLRDLVL
ncbi:MAG: hypothetical protein U0930_00175 [Pirellulales bacterium]